MTQLYKITNERREDLYLLSEVELKAAALLSGHAPESVLSETTSLKELESANAAGRLWLALAGEVPVGFAHIECVDGHRVHLKEIDVHPIHGRRGLGRAMLNAVSQWSGSHGFREITLTTFRDVPFNGPFYESFGFEVISSADLDESLRCILAEESRRGLDAARRVAMLYRIPR